MLETKIDKKLTINFVEAEVKLKRMGQLHLLKSWDALSEKEKKLFLLDIESLDEHFLSNVSQSFESSKCTDLEPFKDYYLHSKEEFSEKGSLLIKEGKVGTVIAAGGEGTRFGFNGPKGCFPISNIRGKSLFQLFAEKTLYASRLVGEPLSLAIMTSKKNHRATIEYFERYHYFGLDSSQISFFQQTEVPLLDSNKNLFLESPFEIAKGPDGNGAFFQSFYSSGVWGAWQKKGIKIVNYIPIDNPLADPFDANLIGYHAISNSEVTLKCITRIDPQEKVGVVAIKNGKVKVIEYSEIDENEKFAQESNGSLKHLCANISLLCMEMEFVKSVAINPDMQLPYHLALKAGHYKCEKFIFDMFPYAKKIGALLYPRADCFAPLKNANGNDSPLTVKEALLQKDIDQWNSISTTIPTQQLFELSQEFYYPNSEFTKKWKNKIMPSTNYIQGDSI